MAEQIFQQKNAQFQPMPSVVTYSDNVNSQDYVAQFLNVFDPVNQDSNSGHQTSPSQLMNDGVSAQNSGINDNTQRSFESQNAAKSCFHNFQKHLVKTLKNLINSEQIQQNLETKSLQKRLWDFFMKNNKNTRTLLYLILGGIDLESKKSKKIQRQYGLMKILKNEESSHIIKAQKNLNAQILRQSQKINLDLELKNRRIKDKQNFQTYFMAFLQELKSGKFNKRVPKQKKKNAQQLFEQTNKDFQGLSSNKA